MTTHTEPPTKYDPDPLVYAPMYLAFYHAAQRFLTRLMALWSDMPDLREVLRYEKPVTRETCTQLITAVRALHAQAQETADYVEHYPSEATLPTRWSMRRLVEQLDDLLLHLVVFREQCTELSVAVLRQRQELMARFAQVRETLLSEALTSLEDDAENCNVGEEWHIEKGPAPTPNGPDAAHSEAQQHETVTPHTTEEEKQHATRA